MKIRFVFFLILVVVLALLHAGCKKVREDFSDTEEKVFNFSVTESQRMYINTSRGIQYEVTNPVPELSFAGNIYTIDRFEIRGENTLNFTRKSFGVNMQDKLQLINSETMTGRKYEEFKLLAMVYDYTYIENSTAIGFFKEVGLWPVFSFFTEVSLNNHTQGLYLFIEDPVEYFIEQKNSTFVLRRGYDHVVKASDPGSTGIANPQKYLTQFKKIYSSIKNYSGLQLYDTLSTYMDMEQYFTKLSIDMYLKNGDYTDEIFFYTKIHNGREVFGVFPWDVDDLFSEVPHEIGRAWATGTVFGHREYAGMADIIADVGSKLLFSVEDDIDYKIARDSVLYQQYLKTLRGVIEKIDNKTIDKIFDYTYEHISPFYSDASVIDQSKYDVNQTNYNLFISNLKEKRQMLKDRRTMIVQNLDLQQNRR
jgi:spore coat protein H